MRLYMISSVWRGVHVFYWAKDEDDAISQYQEIHKADENEPVRADMVWAENSDPALRGYVINND